MITYEVSAVVDASIAERYERYMIGQHLRDVLASGCFIDATLERTDGGRYRTRYRAASQSDLDRYLRDHTAALRQHFADHFPTGVRLEREVWAEVHRRGAER